MVIYTLIIIISLFVFYNFGNALLIILERLFNENFKPVSFTIVLLLGMMVVSNIFTYYAIYFPLDWISFLISVIFSVFIFLKIIWSNLTCFATEIREIKLVFKKN